MTEPVILLPLDGSQPALHALPVARVFSALEGAPLRIMHVADRHRPCRNWLHSWAWSPGCCAAPAWTAVPVSPPR